MKMFSAKPKGQQRLTVEELEKVTSDEVNQFTENAKKELDTFRINTDTEYWFCVVFPSREEKDEFLKREGLYGHSDKYIDGMYYAKRRGYDLKQTVKFPKFKANDKAWSELSMPLPESDEKGGRTSRGRVD